MHTVPYNDDSTVMMMMTRTKIMTTSRLFAYCSILTSKLSSTATIVWGLKVKAMMNTMMMMMFFYDDYDDDFVKHDDDDFLLSQLFDRLSQCKEVGTIEGAA